jgi:hypothetical protein
MNGSQKGAMWFAPRRHSSRLFFAMAALALCEANLRAQTPPAAASTATSTSPMNQFALIFRQTSKPLSDVDQQRRAVEVRAWAQRQIKEERKLDPHILTGENRQLRPDGRHGPVSVSEEGNVTAIVFLEARDFAEAVKIAESHPGLRYGVSIEVRPWGPPPPAPPPQR